MDNLNTELIDKLEDSLAEISFTLLGSSGEFILEDVEDIKTSFENIIINTSEEDFTELNEYSRKMFNFLEDVISEKIPLDGVKNFIATFEKEAQKLIKKKNEGSLTKSAFEEIYNIQEEKIDDVYSKKEIENTNNDEAEKEEKKNKKEEAENLQVLLFNLKNVIYAVESRKIVEIKSFNDEELTIIPNLNEKILGFINLRGEVIPLVDLRLFFNVKDKSEIDYKTKEDIIIAVKHEGRITGLLVDRAEDFVNIAEKDIINNTNFRDIKQEYIKGVINNIDYEFIVLLNIDNFLSEEKLIENFL